jgi:quinol monooxygenase YgiN
MEPGAPYFTILGAPRATSEWGTKTEIPDHKGFWVPMWDDAAAHQIHEKNAADYMEFRKGLMETLGPHMATGDPMKDLAGGYLGDLWHCELAGGSGDAHIVAFTLTAKDAEGAQQILELLKAQALEDKSALRYTITPPGGVMPGSEATVRFIAHYAPGQAQQWKPSADVEALLQEWTLLEFEAGNHYQKPAANPLILTVTNKWNDGKTKEDVAAALSAMQAKAMTVEGVFAFQYSMNEEKKENIVTEVYADASVVPKFFAAVGEVELPALVGAITTTSTLVAGPKAQCDGVAEALGNFNPEFFYTDDVGGAVAMPEGPTGADMPIIMTVQNTWNEGQTKEQVVAALKQMQEKAITVDGVYAFQYAVNEEKKLNQVTEIYKDGGAIGAFFGAVGEVELPALVGAITTTSTIATGPQAQCEGVAGALEKFGPQFFYSDAVGAACKGFEGKAA